MSNHHNRDYQGGWSGGYPQQPGGGGFAAHNAHSVQHRYQEDDFIGVYPSQSQHQQHGSHRTQQGPLYARGGAPQQRGGGGGGGGYVSHRGHPQMGSHQQHHLPNQRPQYGQDFNGYGPVNGWHQQQAAAQSSRVSAAPSQQGGGHRFGGFNPNAAVFTPGAPFGGGGGGASETIMQATGNPYHNAGFAPQPYYPMPHHHQQQAQQQPSYEGLDEETAAYEAMYSNQQEPHQFMPSQELHEDIMKDPESQRISEVLVGLEQLISDPDDYESWSGAIKERMLAMKDPQRSICVRIMLEMLMSCSESSLPMMPAAGGVLARLMETMAREMHSSVAAAILPNLERLHTERASYGNSERAAMISLMGELFDRMETQGGGKIEKLGLAVVEHMKEMLKPDCISEPIMKDLIYTAKIAGPGLDASPTTKSANDDLLTTMSAFGKGHPKLSESTKNEISVLIEQRESGWASRMHGVSSYGQLSFLNGASHSSSSSSSAPAGCIIGPDGKALALSEEEQRFLEEQFGGVEDEADEMYAEMDKFLREEQEKKAARRNEQLMQKLKICENEDGQA